MDGLFMLVLRSIYGHKWSRFTFHHSGFLAIFAAHESENIKKRQGKYYYAGLQ